MTQAHGWKNGKALVKLGRYDEALRAYDGASTTARHILEIHRNQRLDGQGKCFAAQIER